MWNSDILSGVLVLGVTALAWTQSRDFSYYGGVFVDWVLVVLAVLGLILLVSGIRNQKTAEKIRFTRAQIRRLLGLGGALVGYLFLIYLVGFVLGSIVSYAFICLMLCSEEKRFTLRAWAESAGAGTLITALFYVVFKYALLVPLPAGVLFG